MPLRVYYCVSVSRPVCCVSVCLRAHPTEKPRYVETWDFEVSGSSFLQFDLSMGCSKAASASHGVRLEFSTDGGRRWALLTPECVPPAIGCSSYTQSSIYSAPQYSRWKRVTVYLPSVAK